MRKYTENITSEGIRFIMFTREMIDVFGSELGRRHALKLGLTALLLVCSRRGSLAAVTDALPRERSLSFRETHTGEVLSTLYWVDGRYVPEAMAAIDRILRDYRTGEIKPIDKRLLDFLHAIRFSLGTREPFHVISGYRSPSTNAMLHQRNPGVAKKSLHMSGKAIDIRVPGCCLSRLRRVALDLRGGGVGYYRQSNFVHVDVGRVRSW